MDTLEIAPSILYVGTPVVLVGTTNPDGSPNLAPMSSAWALGWTIVLGLGTDGQTYANLERTRELTLSLPSAELWEAVERLAPLTGRSPVPAEKRHRSRFEPAKFEAAGLTPRGSVAVAPPRVDECPLQLEATVARLHTPAEGDGWAIVEAAVQRVHAHQDVVVPGTNHIDPERWEPLLYVFRHYFGTGPELGRSFRSETPRAPTRPRASA